MVSFNHSMPKLRFNRSNNSNPSVMLRFHFYAWSIVAPSNPLLLPFPAVSLTHHFPDMIMSSLRRQPFPPTLLRRLAKRPRFSHGPLVSWMLLSDTDGSVRELARSIPSNDTQNLHVKSYYTYARDN